MDNFTNITINLSNMNVPYFRDPEIQYVTESHHAISFGEIFIILALFIFLAYWLIRVSRNREYYTHWKNPNGKEINLYNKVRLFFWLYTAVVIIAGLLQAYLTAGG